MDEFREVLTKEMIAEIQHLANMEKGTEAHAKAVADIAKLYGMSVDDLKTKLAEQELIHRSELERDKHYLAERSHDEQKRLDEAEFKSKRNERRVNLGLQAAFGFGNMALTLALFLLGIDFEREGTIRSTFLRNLISKAPGFKK